jgi:hypothetical protein
VVELRKNAANEQLLQLNYESVRRIWMQPQMRNLSEAFREVAREVNNPPLLLPAQREPLPVLKSMRDFSLGRTRSSGLAEKVVGDLENEIFVLQEKQETVESLRQENDYKAARIDFIRHHAGRLEKALKGQEARLSQELDQLRGRHEQMVLTSDVAPLLALTALERAKVRAAGRAEAVREGERRLVQGL